MSERIKPRRGTLTLKSNKAGSLFAVWKRVDKPAGMSSFSAVVSVLACLSVSLWTGDADLFGLVKVKLIFAHMAGDSNLSTSACLSSAKRTD